MFLSLSLLTALLGFLIVIFNCGKNKSACYLAVFYISLASYEVTHYLTIYQGNPIWFAAVFAHFSPVWFLLGPCMYLYTRNLIIGETHIKKADLVHGIPFVIHIINLSPYGLLAWEDKLRITAAITANVENLRNFPYTLLYGTEFAFLMRPTLFIGYLFASILLLFKQSSMMRVKTERHWLTFFLGVSSVMILVFIIYTLGLVLHIPGIDSSNESLLPFVVGILLFVLAGGLLIFPSILYGTNSVTIRQKPIDPVKDLNVEINDSQKQLAQKIRNYLEKKKPYKDPAFSMNKIALDLQVPIHQVSFCFTHVFDIKFTQMRTTLRVEYAQELLQQGLGDNQTIDHIGQMAGFPSRSTFYAAFKSETGLTPQAFMDLQQKNTSL